MMRNIDRIVILVLIAVGVIIFHASLYAFSWYLGFVGAYIISYVEYLRSRKSYLSHKHCDALYENFERIERRIKKLHKHHGHVFGKYVD